MKKAKNNISLYIINHHCVIWAPYGDCSFIALQTLFFTWKIKTSVLENVTGKGLSFNRFYLSDPINSALIWTYRKTWIGPLNNFFTSVRQRCTIYLSITVDFILACLLYINHDTNKNNVEKSSCTEAINWSAFLHWTQCFSKKRKKIEAY